MFTVTGELPHLGVPSELLPSAASQLPVLTHDTLGKLQKRGWSRVGLMVALTDEDTGEIAMISHVGRDKNQPNALGPLGETSKRAGPVIEQPVETLFRGIKEELGVKDPQSLGLRMQGRDGWVVNKWPRGVNYPGEFACAISFAAFMPHGVLERLVAAPHGNEEANGLLAMHPEAILAASEDRLRPGVKPWLAQLQRAKLLDPAGPLVRVDFSNNYQTALLDIDLQGAPLPAAVQ